MGGGLNSKPAQHEPRVPFDTSRNGCRASTVPSWRAIGRSIRKGRRPITRKAKCSKIPKQFEMGTRQTTEHFCCFFDELLLGARPDLLTLFPSPCGDILDAPMSAFDAVPPERSVRCWRSASPLPCCDFSRTVGIVRLGPSLLGSDSGKLLFQPTVASNCCQFSRSPAGFSQTGV